MLLEKIIQNQAMPQLLDFGRVDDLSFAKTPDERSAGFWRGTGIWVLSGTLDYDRTNCSRNHSRCQLFFRATA